MVKYDFSKPAEVNEAVTIIQPALRPAAKTKAPVHVKAVPDAQTAAADMYSSLGKDERKFRLQTGLEQGTLTTITQAVAQLNVSAGTIRRYLLELNITVVGDVMIMPEPSTKSNTES